SQQRASLLSFLSQRMARFFRKNKLCRKLTQMLPQSYIPGAAVAGFFYFFYKGLPLTFPLSLSLLDLLQSFLQRFRCSLFRRSKYSTDNANKNSHSREESESLPEIKE